MRPFSAAAAAALLSGSGMLSAAPVISEIMYRPGTAFPENTALEYIELHNPGTTPAAIGGWAITSGVQFTFPAGTTIPAGGYLAVAANPAQLTAAHGNVPVAGPWAAGVTLSNNGERIVLSKPGATAGSWTKVDEVIYATEGDWGLRVRESAFNGWDWTSPADGGGKSMELRNPALSNDNGQNWAPSTASSGGTPGSANTVNTANVPPVIHAVKHSPAVPRSSDPITISCEVNDESPAAERSATLFYRDASSNSPDSFQSLTMTSDGSGKFKAVLTPWPNQTILEFYISSTDGTNTRNWPAPTSEGQNANCVLQVDDEAISATADTYRLTLTAAENQAFNNVSSSSDRQFNMTLIALRGSETTIRYRSSMRIRGNSSRSYQFRPLRVRMPNDNAWDGITSFNLHPRSPHLQHLGMRLFQAAGLAASDTIPVELRRNGVEYTTGSGSTPDYGMWARVEPEGREYVDNHWPVADDGNLYTKRSPERYWRSAGWTVPGNPDGLLDNWSKQNNGAANDWSDLTGFFTAMQSATAPHFPGSSPTDVSQSNGSRLSGIGNWARTGLNGDQLEQVQTVADTDQWARFFAVMTIMQDYETNVSNGVDDDYGIYFVPSPGNQRRAQLVPHDLDTIFGQGDTRPAYNAVGLFDMTEGGASGYAFRTLLPLVGTSANIGNADWRNTYFSTLRLLLGTVFDTDTAVSANPPFYQFVDSHLGGWSPASVNDQIKEFVRQRRLYLLDLIPDGVTGGQAATALKPAAPTAQATLASAHQALIISEVLAANVTAHQSNGLFRDVIELHNTGATPLTLDGMSLTDDSVVKEKYVFGTGTVLNAGQRLVLYADSDFVAPGLHTGFQLDQQGDSLYLYSSPAAGQTLIDSVTFGPQAADYSIGRTGASLNTWALCTPTIGGANTAVSTTGSPAALRVNEWLSNPDYRFSSDFVELHNPEAAPVPLGGLRLTDDFVNYPSRHVLPVLSFMAPGAYLMFEAKGNNATAGNPVELPFSLNSSFGSISLMGANGTTIDHIDVIAQRRDESAGRTPDGSDTLTTFAVPSPGLPNGPLPASYQALLDGLRISEILYKPDGGSDYEFVELLNISAAALDLSGVRFTNGIDYTFPEDVSLAPGHYLVVCRNRISFLSRFPLAAHVLAPGQFAGSLDNSGETITLKLPRPWEAAVLSFKYEPDWELLTSTAGYSLTAVDPAATPARDWNERETWMASGTVHGTPGSDGPPGINSPLSASVIIGDSFSYTITATREPELFGAEGLPAGLSVDPQSGLISGTASEAGVFNVLISAANTAGSDEKTLVLTVATSGPLHHFTWQFTPASAAAGVPFGSVITALDAQGRLVESFSGTATLTATAETGGASQSTVMITEVTDEDEDQFEIQNTGNQSVNTSGWIAAVGHSTGVNALNGTLWQFPASMAPGEILRVSEFNQAGRIHFGSGISWTTSTAKGWVMILDNTTTPRDFFAWGWTAAELATLNVTISGQPITLGSQWTGNGAALGSRVNGNDSWQRTGSSDHNNASDWIFASNGTSWSATNTGLVLPWQSAGAVPVTPGSVTFANGIFAGHLTIPQVATGVRITAASGPLNVQSGTFDVAAAPADADGDRMPDAWESANGFNPAINDAAGDTDSDGMSNLTEFYAGTNPRLATSRLAVSSVSSPAAGQYRLTWNAAAGQIYRIRYGFTPAAWQDVPGQILVPAVSGNQTATFTIPAALQDRGFFRVEMLTPP